MYFRNDNYVMRRIHDTYFFIDITDNYKGDKCKLIETNEIGAFIWNQVGETAGIEEIAKNLMCNIREEVPFDIIFNDVRTYLQMLEQKHIVVREMGNERICRSSQK